MTSRSPRLPSRQECQDMLDEWQIPDNIRRHMQQVNRISVFLARKLKESGLPIDVELVDRASLLHDLDKLRTKTDGMHGILTEQYLVQQGYPEVGACARHHCFASIHDSLVPWEGRIVNYADKRVIHDRIVPLSERLTDLKQRYHVINPDLPAEAKFYKLEQDIFGRIGLDPAKLESYL